MPATKKSKKKETKGTIKIDMPFEDALKKILTTPAKKKPKT